MVNSDLSTYFWKWSSILPGSTSYFRAWLTRPGKTTPVLTVKTPDALLKALKNGKKMEKELAGH
jgi:hypothetical protein